MATTNPILRYLDEHGPCLTTELTQYLVATRRIKAATARQQVSRMPSEVKRLAYITFPRNARFVYLVKDYGSARFWASLIAALEATNSAYGAALAAVRARGGIVPRAHFQIVCGSPIQQKKHLSAERVLTRLLESKLLASYQVDGVGECICLPMGEDFRHSPAREVRSRLLAEGILLSAITEWLRNNGIVSYGRVARRDKGATPTVSTTAWDVSAPCYLAGLLPRGPKTTEKTKQGFVACDILLNRVDAVGLRPFIRKCLALRSLPRVGPCIQMFVAESYTSEGRDLLKQNGIIAATTSSLFGKDVATALRALRSLFEAILSGEKEAIDGFDQILGRFSVIEGAALQLRGTLFEFLAERLARYEFRAHNTYMNRVFTEPSDKRKTAEADVIAVYGKSDVVFIECKSTSVYSQVPDEQFARWLQHNIPTIYSSIRAGGEWQDHSLSFEFWASAPLTQKSMELYEAMKQTINPNRYSIRVRLGPELSGLCEAMGDRSIITAFDKHFTA